MMFTNQLFPLPSLPPYLFFGLGFGSLKTEIIIIITERSRGKRRTRHNRYFVQETKEVQGDYSV